jgi:thiol-disulfide isomerase/thioredoxin
LDSTINKIGKKDSAKTVGKIVKDTINKKTIVSKVLAVAEEVGPKQMQSKFANYSNYNGKIISADAGKKIVCMFAPGCEHCQATAKEICALRGAGFPEVTVIFMDEETEKIPAFFKEAGCTFPYQVVDIPTFWTLLGNGTTPNVNAMWNGNIVKSWEGIDVNKFVVGELKGVMGVK